MSWIAQKRIRGLMPRALMQDFRKVSDDARSRCACVLEVSTRDMIRNKGLWPEEGHDEPGPMGESGRMVSVRDPSSSGA